MNALSNPNSSSKKPPFNPPAMAPVSGNGGISMRMTLQMKLSPKIKTGSIEVDYSAIWKAHGKVPPKDFMK